MTDDKTPGPEISREVAQARGRAILDAVAELKRFHEAWTDSAATTAQPQEPTSEDAEPEQVSTPRSPARDTPAKPARNQDQDEELALKRLARMERRRARSERSTQ